MKKILFFVAAAIVALTSCKDAKQSELSLDAKAGEATITGQVVYDAGYVLEGTEIVKAVRPVESGKVVVIMNYDQMGTGEGSRQFTGEIVNGVYAVKVPVSLKSVEVTFKVEPFMDVYGDLNHKNEIIATSAFFKASNPITVVGLVANETRKLDRITMKADKMYNPTREQVLVIAGKAVKDSIDLQSREPLANTELTITATYSQKPDESLVFTTTTNAKGEYELKMKLFDSWSEVDQIRVQVEAMPYEGKAKYGDKEVKGLFMQMTTVMTTLSKSAFVKQMMESDLYMAFHPYEPVL